METKTKILVIEDDKYISNFIAVSLKKEDYEVYISQSAADGLFMFSSYRPDIILLDLGLPDQDGLEIIKELRQFTEIPILVVSARGQENDKIEALDMGASDYVTKPFHMGELMARIRVAERALSLRGGNAEETIYKFDYLTVDYEKRKVLVDENEVHLTPLEYKLLLLLIENQGKVLTHNYIIRKIWGYEAAGDNKSLRVFMANLRRKIGKGDSGCHLISTEVGVGYRFLGE
ncbi:MAG TPA: response regulator transcription factor [Gudongella oleilytica]|jgi:two-component system KDP operon response regulator KdpE|nr:response regulator transcription factor [Gudongella oleilytica]